MFQWINEKRKPALDRRQSLEGVPVLSQGLTVEEKEGRLHVTLKMRRDGGLWSRFLPPVMERTVKLDELGAFVFKKIDGRKNVLDLVNEFASTYRVNRREAELSTAEFIRRLAQRNVISIVIR